MNPRSWAANKKEERLWFYRDMHRAIALGSILWLGITTCLSEEGTEYHAYAPKAIAFRKSLQPMLKHAQFADDACRSSARAPAGSCRTGAGWFCFRTEPRKSRRSKCAVKG